MTEYKGYNAATEAVFKQMFAYQWEGISTGQVRTGVLDPFGSGGPLRVTQTTTASSSVEVFRGMAIVQDSLLNGATPLLSNATKTLDVLGPNPMGATPRNDIVVFDAATTSIRNIVGTPNAAPTDPTIPATAVPLARLRHAASATTVPTAKIDDLRVWTGPAHPVKPVWRGYANVTQAKVASAVAGLTLTEDYALSGSFPSAGLSCIRTMPIAGVWELRARVTWAARSDGLRMLELRKNVTGTDLGTGTALDRDQHGASTQLETNTAFHRGVFAAGDRVSVGVMHTSTGGNLDVIFTPYQTWFEIAYVRPA